MRLRTDLEQISKSKMAAHPRSAAKKSTGFYEELKENFGDDRRTKRSAKKKGEAALRQSDDLFEIEVKYVIQHLHNKGTARTNRPA